LNLRLSLVTALLGSLLVVFSQLVTAFTLQDPQGIHIGNLTLLDKHGPVAIVIAAIAALAVLYLFVTGMRDPETARSATLSAGIVIVGMGAAVILIFLLVDLPDVGNTGLYDTPGAGNLDATGTAAAGLWLELVSGLVLVLAGGALLLAGRTRGLTDEPEPERGNRRGANRKPDPEELS